MAYSHIVSLLHLLYVFKWPSSGGIGLGVNFSVLWGGLYFFVWLRGSPGTKGALEVGEELLATWVITCLLCRRLERFGGECEGGARGL